MSKVAYACLMENARELESLFDFHTPKCLLKEIRNLLHIKSLVKENKKTTAYSIDSVWGKEPKKELRVD